MPQRCLKQWAASAGKVWQYRLLVSSATVSVWELKPCKGVGFRNDLYTSERDGLPSDEFERWLEAEFERPAQVALARVLSGQPLAPQHWRHLGRFAICQQLRTPQNLFENLERWRPQFSEMGEDILKTSVGKMEVCRFIVRLQRTL